MANPISANYGNSVAAIQSFVDRALDTPAEEREALIGELRRPDGSLTRVAREFQSQAPMLFRDLFPELASAAPAPQTVRTVPTDVNDFVSRVIDTPEDRRAEFVRQVRRDDGALTELGQGLDPELRTSLFPKIAPEPSRYSLPKNLILELGIALGKLEDTTNFASIKEKISGLQREFKGVEDATGALNDLYLKELPPLVGPNWNKSEVRTVLGRALSEIGFAEDDNAENSSKRRDPDSASEAPRAKVPRVDSERGRSAHPPFPLPYSPSYSVVASHSFPFMYVMPPSFQGAGGPMPSGPYYGSAASQSPAATPYSSGTDGYVYRF
jgi:transposase-like protein